MTAQNTIFAVDTQDYGTVALTVSREGRMLARRMPEEHAIQPYNPGTLAARETRSIVHIDSALACPDGRTLGTVVNELWKCEEAVQAEHARYRQELQAKHFDGVESGVISSLIMGMEIRIGPGISPKRQKSEAYLYALANRAALYSTVRQALAGIGEV